jgi:hypothetical protein
MAYNGDGTFSLPYSWTLDASNGVPITASRMDTQFNNCVSGFDLCVTRDGQGAMAANFTPSIDDAYDLGTSVIRWRSLYLSGNATVTGTENVDQINAHTANAGVGIQGVATNTDAVAGNTGQYGSTSIPKSTVTLSSGVASDVGSISLTAGDWDVTANVTFTLGAATVISQHLGWISATSATLPSLPDESYYETNATITAPGVGVDETALTGTKRFLLAATTTIYFSAQGTFTGGTLKAGGIVRARRVR